MKYIKPEIISLKNSPEFNEKWLQARINEDPSILGLGELEFLNTEKILIGGGRLDTILYDPDDFKRYEVEIQLGKTDESHIIRTIEYWDIEKKRNPQYEHCAVIIAEDITSRFLNVISLFNGFIPLIAIQVKAVRFEDNISLFFTKVLDETRFEMYEVDSVAETTDRDYWDKKASKTSLKLIDDLLLKINDIVGDYKLKYNKHYIGLEKNGAANNFISFKPRKSSVIFQARLSKTDEVDSIIEGSELDELEYEKRWKQYRFRINKVDLTKNIDVLKSITIKAKDEYGN